MRPPGFWRHGGAPLPAWLLSPLSPVVAAITARRVARPGWRAPVPVICCGNPGSGGAGKTPLALEIASRLRARGIAAHCLTRGHGGRLRGVVRADPARHDAAAIGDEALLLAAAAPCWIARDRAAGARAAIAAGAEALVMDDGLQNPTLEKTLSFLVIDGGAGFGNGRVLPAGPLRETVAAAAARCQAAVLIGEDRFGAAAQLGALPVLRAVQVPGPEAAALAGARVYALAGIGRPGKFFAMLEAAGITLAGREAFADHHRFSITELHHIESRARALGAVPVCTEKDHVRLPAAWRQRIRFVSMKLQFAEPEALDRWLGSCSGS